MSAAGLLLPEEGLAAVRSRRARPGWLTTPVVLGLVVAVGWIVVALTIQWWAPYSPTAPSGSPLVGPSGAHLLGTDELGRDVLTRTLYGARESLPLAFAVVAGGVSIGTLAGGIAGFFGGWVDAIVMRIVDLTLAFPAILLAMVMTASLGPGLFHIGIALVIVWWPIYARLLRAQILSVKESPHVEAAVAAGASRWRLFRVHILPLAFTPLLINATIDLGQVVLLASGLSFIGLGAVPPTPEWGLMINDATGFFYQWWIALGPGLAILSIVLAFSFIGDGLRDLFDVRSSESSW
ncbi:MAG TPA: ABC transporter permease [Acidimicrobiales bacterium]|nr:ABC transporter permease [Acidimicrobiales bacterium]